MRISDLSSDVCSSDLLGTDRCKALPFARIDQVNDIASGHDEFARVLDRKQSLVGRDALDARFRQGRLTGPVCTPDQDILARGPRDLVADRPVPRFAKSKQRRVGFGKTAGTPPPRCNASSA